MRRARVATTLTLVSLLLATACGGTPLAAHAESLTLYTCVSDTTVQPVLREFEKIHPGRPLHLYRAPTGELNARVAGEVRSGGLKADVIWACDPLTMEGYLAHDLVGGWIPKTDIPATARTADYVGVAMLYMVAVNTKGTPPIGSWSDLTDQEYRGGVALPDPKTAASALGALGYFAQDQRYGLDFYAALKKNGAVQVSTPDNVTTGVAEGVYRAGLTTANSAYAAQESGSPIEVVWPAPGAIGIYGPIALARHSGGSVAAKDFISFVTSKEGQTVIGQSGSYPTLPGVGGPTMPAGAPVVYPDWSTLSTQKGDLMGSYSRIFGG